jgi:hypothetical protein
MPHHWSGPSRPAKSKGGRAARPSVSHPMPKLTASQADRILLGSRLASSSLKGTDTAAGKVSQRLHNSPVKPKISEPGTGTGIDSFIANQHWSMCVITTGTVPTCSLILFAWCPVVHSVRDPDPRWICIRWPPGSEFGSAFPMRIRIQEV